MSNGWATVPLGEVLTERSEVPDEESLLAGEVRIVAKIGFNDGKILLRQDGETKTGMILIRPGDLVVSGINAAKGAIAVYGDDNLGPIAATIHYAAYTPNRDRVDISFLWWLLRSQLFRDLLLRYVPGGIKTELKAKRLLPIPVPLPDLSEQRRIVTRIEALSAKRDEARAEADRANVDARNLVGAAISKAFAEGVAAGWRQGVLGDYVVDCCYGTSRKTDDDSSGTPILRMGNIQDGRLDARDLKYLVLEKIEQERLVLTKGDILVNRTNSAELVGKCAMFELPGEFAFASYLIRLRLDQRRASPQLVAAYINSPAGRGYMFRKRKQMTGQANVNSKTLRQLPLALPDISEQFRIVEMIDAIATKVAILKGHQEQSIAALDALLPSILDKAFRGEL